MRLMHDQDAARTLENAYAQHPDPAMTALLASVRPVDDDAIADLIELDGRARLERGLPVTVERYFGAISDLENRRVALDAAIEFAIRSAVRSGTPEKEAADQIARKHPKLASAVRIAVGLNDGIASTTVLVGMVNTRAALQLPCDFGPLLTDGRKRFDVRQRLGGGTQGDVYLAADRALAEPDKPAWVAIKRLNVKSMVDAERAAFAEEARKARRIEHPNVVRVLDRGEDSRDGEFVIYEYVDGGDLAAACGKRAGPLPPRDAAELMSQVCAGVQAAHVAGVVHCDLKPSNILLTREGRPKVADFGVATRVAAGDRDGLKSNGPIGNLAFIAPEQFLGKDGALAIPADVYALGGLLFYLLTAKLPNGDTPEEVERRHRSTTPIAPPSARAIVPDIDTDLNAICERALARDPRERYQSAEALGADLRAWLERRPIEWTHPGTLRRTALLIRRQPIASAVAVLAVVLAVVGAAATVYTAMSAREKQYQASIAALRAVDQERQRGYDSVRESFGSISSVLAARNRGQLNEEWFPALTVLESVMGPVLLQPQAWAKPDLAEVWSGRVKTIQSHLENERKAQRANTIENALWLDTLAFWGIRSGDAEGARTALAEGDVAWGNRLNNTDPWNTVRAAMRSALKAMDAMNAAKTKAQAGQKPDAQTTQQLTAAAEELKGAISALEREGRRGTVRSSLVVILSRLYQPEMLNQPEALKSLMEAETRATTPDPLPKSASESH